KVPVVAIVMEKGWEQVVAAVAILRIHCAYLPMDAKTWPEQRIRQVLEMSEAAAVLTQSFLLSEGFAWLEDLSIPVLSVDALGLRLQDTVKEDELRPLQECVEQYVISRRESEQGLFTSDLAYLIYTSGSTGLPKGVCCHHRGCMNTIQDLNDRYKVGEQDRLLGLSSLSFDLSVYDIFGMLHAGGCLVLPSVSSLSPPDPAEWFDLLEQEAVTVWNTVPAFMELIVSHAEMMGVKLPRTLRLIFMSGDWIPTNLPQRIRAVSENVDNLQIVSMGGATEASIWSNIFEVRQEDEHGSGVPSGWRSIPYGQPMRNQRMYILNHRMQHCEPWVTGVIYIGGVGVAHGYYKNPERTAYQFVTHPVTGEKLFRTGDLGRLRPEGWLEILGREDSQVKVNGYRVELGEIEKTLMMHERVLSAVVAVHKNTLCAYIVLR
ncbi:amino acid adenylation domain-containing protein, partial [archaeon]